MTKQSTDTCKDCGEPAVDVLRGMPKCRTHLMDPLERRPEWESKELRSAHLTRGAKNNEHARAAIFLHISGYTYMEIAKEIGFSSEMYVRELVSIGKSIIESEGQKLDYSSDPNSHDRVKELRSQGLSYRAISERLGIGHCTLWNRLKKCDMIGAVDEAINDMGFTAAEHARWNKNLNDLKRRLRER